MWPAIQEYWNVIAFNGDAWRVMMDHRFGQMVKNSRDGRGWSQEKLAGESGVSPQAISNIERGQSSPTLANALSLSKTLGIDLGELTPRNPAVDAEAMKQDALQILSSAKNMNAEGLSLLRQIASVLETNFPR